MLTIFFVLLATIVLAYANGANDNFKGVATLWGSGTIGYKQALGWATVTTFMGSLTALFVASGLIAAFSGKGLVPEAVVNNPDYLISVALGAAFTVLIATLAGIPVSTTHSLTGALVGSGLVAVGMQINFYTLANSFFLPLLISPLLAIFLTMIIYPCFRVIRIRLGIEREMCLCIGESVEPVCARGDGVLALKSTGRVLTVDQFRNCKQHYYGKILGFDSQTLLDRLHYLSAGLLSFARGLNDTPKIVALLLLTSAFSLNRGILIVAIAIAMGGILNARKVALTMSYRITGMNHSQGFCANLVTAFLVIFASRWGLPVSTTHVSCGSLFGIGLINKKADGSVIKHIVLAWGLTLPLAAILSAGCFFMLSFF